MTPGDEHAEVWLSHAQALRRLASSLVRDPHVADDLVQSTWLAAQRTGNERPSRKWMRAVLRNLGRDSARERDRRAFTESVAARAEALPSAAEIAERLEVARRLADEVAKLDEPYRTAIHLRYFEDLRPEEIAERGGWPLETVRSRLRRGLTQLRERMDRGQRDDRTAWAVALAPIAAHTNVGTTASLSLAGIGGIVMGTKLAIAAAAIVVGTSAFLLWQRSHAGAHYEGTAIQLTDTALDASREVPRSAIEAPSVDPRAAVRAPAIAPPVGVASTTVHGRVVIVDEDGRELRNESGVLSVGLAAGPSNGRIEEIAFENGAWQIDVPPEHWLVVARLVARGRQAALPEPSPLPLDQGEIVVRGEWLSRGRLRVVDAQTKRELSNVEVRCSRKGWRANPRGSHPGDDPKLEAIVEHAPSPIELPESTHWMTYWLHAPGYAWGRIDFDHKQGGGQRTVELSPARGRVLVTPEGIALPENAFVRLYRAEAKPKSVDGVQIVQVQPEGRGPQSWTAAVSVSAKRSGPTEIDDFEPGSYVASVELGTYEDQLRLGEAPVEVLADESVSVSVPIDASLVAVPRTHLFGTIDVPEGLDRASCELVLERVGGGQAHFRQKLAAMSFAHGEESVLHWDAGPMRTGDYVATIGGIEHREVIHTQDSGDTRVALKIPPLVTVIVEVVEATTGAPIEPERLAWNDGPIEVSVSFSSVRIFRDPKTQRFQFIAPRGNVSISCSKPGYQGDSNDLTLEGSEMTVRLELAKATGVHISIREGGAAVQAGFEFFDRVRIKREDGRGIPVDSGDPSTESESTYLVRQPGRYRIHFPELAGFEPIPPQLVDVPESQVVEVLLAVQRKS